MELPADDGTSRMELPGKRSKPKLRARAAVKEQSGEESGAARTAKQASCIPCPGIQSSERGQGLKRESSCKTRLGASLGSKNHYITLRELQLLLYNTVESLPTD